MGRGLPFPSLPEAFEEPLQVNAILDGDSDQVGEVASAET
jgi:hypothetical protein